MHLNLGALTFVTDCYKKTKAWLLKSEQDRLKYPLPESFIYWDEDYNAKYILVRDSSVISKWTLFEWGRRVVSFEPEVLEALLTVKEL